MVLDGPDTELAIYEANGNKDKHVNFRIMIGAYYRQGDQNSGYIAPLLPKNVLMRTEIVAASPERENPRGIAIIGKIAAIPDYWRQLPGGHLFYIPMLSAGKLVQISYNLADRTGGLAVKSDRPLINSRSELVRVCDCACDHYRITCDAESAPTTSNLKPLSYYQDPRFDCYY